MEEKEYSAGLTHEIFWLQESRKTAELILEGKTKTEIKEIALDKNIYQVTYFDFIQSEKVTDVVKGRSLIAFFEDATGNQISYDVPIIANSREESPDKRTFHEKLTFKSRDYKYGDKYYLRIVDEQDRKNVLQSYEFLIDIAFVDDFGF